MKYIHAEKDDKQGNFRAYEIADNLEAITQDYEYGDVAEGLYQVWEYPSGKIFNVTPDREVGRADYYSVPNNDVWLPILQEERVDKEAVEKAISRLSKA